VTKTCKYCENEFIREFNNQVYCSEYCADRMAKIKKKLRQKEYHNTLEPRICKRCGSSFNFYGMKKLCKECVEVCKENQMEYRKYKKNN